MWHDPVMVEWMQLDIYRLSRMRMAFGLKVAKNSGVGAASEYWIMEDVRMAKVYMK